MALSITNSAISLELDAAIARLQRFAARAGGRPEGWTTRVVDLAGDASGAVGIREALKAIPTSARDVALLVYATPDRRELRASCDQTAFSCGFRRHPLVLACTSFAEIEHETGWLVLLYERIDHDLLRRYPPSMLAVERGLHMDMTREAGRRSDAHLARYQFASERLGRADRVLDAACGLGYGSALLWRDAPARHLTGIDFTPWAIDYANANFGQGEHAPRYEQHDVYELEAFGDETFDAVVSFETIEHLLDPAPFLSHVRRILTYGGLFVASVPYRWVIDGDTGPYHHDWYDVPKLLTLCGRFLSVDDVWVETTGGGMFFPDAPRGLRQLSVLGDDPDDPAEWLLLVARKKRLVRRPDKSWILLAPGVPQLTTMAAALPHWGIAPTEVCVLGNALSWDQDYHTVMQTASEALGFEYGGNLPLNPPASLLGDPLAYRPDAIAPEHAPGDRVATAYPILDDLRDLNVAMTARPTMLGDLALVAGLRPREVRLAADGIQNDCVVRDLTAAPGFEGNPLSEFPTPAEIVCPPWLATETASIGRAHVLDAHACAETLTRIRSTAVASAFESHILTRDVPFTAVVVSQNFARAGLTGLDVAWVFYLHQIRCLLAQTPGAVLFKAHPRDCPHKLAALEAALREETTRVYITRGAENHLPLEAFPSLAGRAGHLAVWGTSSSALLGVKPWAGAQPRCVDADYLEPEIRRQALEFSRRHALPLLTLRGNDPLLAEGERSHLRRRLLSRAEAVDHTLAARLQQAEQARQAADAELRRVTRQQQFLETLVRARGERVWIWGAGAGGRLALQQLRALGVEPVGFIDGRATPEVQEIDNVRVHAADHATAARSADALIVIASIHAEAIQRRIRTAGDWHSTIVTWVA
jgi:SAM-dependent methyltransferase